MADLLETLRDWSASGLRQHTVIGLVERTPFVPDDIRYRFGLVDRPQYAYGVRKAVELATCLGLAGVTVMEFGVGAGGGLKALARHAAYYARRSGLEVRVVGFDSGAGLPEPADYRDLPYVWKQGQYPMQHAELVKELGSPAELVLGDVRDTVPVFLEEQSASLARLPLGFVSFDLDYHSSTTAAFEVFRAAPDAALLPRVTSYFDDIITIVDAVGELAAVAEFNAEQKESSGERDSFLGRVNALRSHLPFDPPWADRIFEYHRFRHPDYGTYESTRDDPFWRP
jgi:hypothetical protein